MIPILIIIRELTSIEVPIALSDSQWRSIMKFFRRSSAITLVERELELDNSVEHLVIVAPEACINYIMTGVNWSVIAIDQLHVGPDGQPTELYWYPGDNKIRVYHHSITNTSGRLTLEEWMEHINQSHAKPDPAELPLERVKELLKEYHENKKYQLPSHLMKCSNMESIHISLMDSSGDDTEHVLEIYQTILNILTKPK